MSSTRKTAVSLHLAVWGIIFISAALWFVLKRELLPIILTNAIGIATLGAVFFGIGYYVVTRRHSM